ncbi:lysoplasmalogenase [bacterium]|nr:lysoplasmalogenase [bacterium]
MGITSIITGCLIIIVTYLIRAEFRANKKQVYFLKPTASLLIVATIVISFFLKGDSTAFKTTILLGMLFCLGGDVALMFDSSKAFKAGLVLFLIGHIFYAATLLAFNDVTFFEPLPSLSVLFVSLLVFRYLFPGLKEMKVPVLFYIIVISIMLNAALLTFQSGFFNETQAWLLAIGAALFYISDIILAVNKFRLPFKYNRISLAFYFAGQLLIALSTHSMSLPA